MELFSVACITCRAKLKVRHVSAIGQILPCPRCGGMVQIAAPAGWKPPAVETPAASNKHRGPAAATSSPSVPDAAADRSTTSATVEPGHDADVYTPAPARPDDDPLTGGPAAASPRERAVRRAVIAVGAIAALLIVAVGLWSSFRADRTAAPPTALRTVATPTSSAAPTSPQAPPRPTVPEPTSAVGSTAPQSPAPLPMVSGTRPSIASTAATSVDPRPSAPSATAAAGTKAAMAKGAATAKAIGTDPPPPAAPSATAAKPVVAERDLDAELRRLQVKLSVVVPQLEFKQTPFRRAVDNLGQIAGLRFHYDWTTIDAAAPLERPLSSNLSSIAVGDALGKLADGSGLRVVAAAGALQIAGADPNAALVVVDYPVDDLAAAEGVLASLVTTFVEPTSWRDAGGPASIVAAAGKLIVSQTPPRQRETQRFLDRLRLARRKAPRGPTSNAVASLDTRLVRAKPALQKPLSMNFRPAVPLRNVLDRIESGSGLIVVVDGPALEASGVVPDEPVGVAARDAATFEVLDAVCEPRGWAWHVPVEGVVEITTAEALRRHAYTEFYDVSQLVGETRAPLDLIAQVLKEIADLPAPYGSTGNETAFDGVSGFLLVRHHQQAHLRVTRLLNDLANPAVAPTAPPAASSTVAPRPNPSASRPRPTGAGSAASPAGIP